MYVELCHESAIKLMKQLVNELDEVYCGKPNYLAKLGEIAAIVSVLNYEMREATQHQEVKS